MKRTVRLLAFFAAMGMVLYFVNESNYIEKKFSSVGEIRAARGVAAPAWLPESAREINYLHNLDTTKVMVRFEMPPGTTVSLPQDCRAVERSQLAAPPMSREWWRGEIPSAGETFYQCAAGQFVALGKTSGYLWGTP